MLHEDTRQFLLEFAGQKMGRINDIVCSMFEERDLSTFHLDTGLNTLLPGQRVITSGLLITLDEDAVIRIHEEDGNLLALPLQFIQDVLEFGQVLAGTDVDSDRHIVLRFFLYQVDKALQERHWQVIHAIETQILHHFEGCASART